MRALTRGACDDGGIFSGRVWARRDEVHVQRLMSRVCSVKRGSSLTCGMQGGSDGVVVMVDIG